MKTDSIKQAVELLFDIHNKISQNLSDNMCQEYIGGLLFLNIVSIQDAGKQNSPKQEIWGGLFDRIEEQVTARKEDKNYFGSLPLIVSQPETGKKINELLIQAENENRNYIKRDGYKDIFSSIDYTLLQKEHLQILTEGIKKLGPILSSRQITGKIYSDYLTLCETENYTDPCNTYLPELFSGILKYESGHTLYDAKGKNGLLLLKCRNNEENILYAQENDPILRLVSKLNMFFNEVKDHCIRNEHALKRPLLKSNRTLLKFDISVCICLSEKKSVLPSEDKIYHRFERGLPPVRHIGWAYLSHLVSVTRKKGIGIIAMPTSTFAAQGSCNHIRKNFIREKVIETVIFLPDNITVIIFRPGVSSNETLLLNVPEWSDISSITDDYLQYRRNGTISQNNNYKIMEIEDWNNNNFNIHPAKLFREPFPDTRQEKNPDLLRKEITLLEAELSHIRSQLEREIGKLMK